jgi:hypothetical protein
VENWDQVGEAVIRFAINTPVPRNPGGVKVGDLFVYLTRFPDGVRQFRRKADYLGTFLMLTHYPWLR